MQSSLPFEAFPVRASRPVHGALLVVASYTLPVLIYVAMMMYGHYTTFGAGRTDSFLGPHTIVSLVLFAGFAGATSIAPRMYKLGAALRQPDAIELMGRDTRAPVLYLRSFDDDAVADLTESIVPIGGKPTIEMRLSSVFRDLGPVISIGRPGERLPEIGANRFYVSDNDWQRAVAYFLEIAAAVVILVGRSTGVSWEIETALRTVPRTKILFVFPFLLPKEKRLSRPVRKRALRRGRADDRVSEATLADLREEHAARYSVFRDRCSSVLGRDLPPDLEGGVFVDFLSDTWPRRLPSRQPLLVRRWRDRQGITLDYRRTLRPFIEKLLARDVKPDRLERLLSSRVGLGLFTVVCALVALACFSALFWLGLGPAGVATFFLASVPATFAYWGAWNWFRDFDWIGAIKRLIAAAAGGWAGAIFGWIVYLAGLVPPTDEAALGALIAAFMDAVGGMTAGLIVGFRLGIWKRIAAVTAVVLVVALVITGLTPLSFQSADSIDAGDMLTFAFPLLTVGAAFSAVMAERRKLRSI